MLSGEEDSRVLHAVCNVREAIAHIISATSLLEDAECLVAAVNNELRYEDEIDLGAPDKGRLTGARLDMESAVRKLEIRRLHVVKGADDAG